MGELAILIPFAPFLLIGFIVWTRHQSKLAEMKMRSNAEISSESAAQHVSHTRELEERVRVLERIITDKGFDVATQIEALRDRRSDSLTDTRDRKGDE